MLRRHFIAALPAALALPVARAQEFPTRPIRIVVPFSPGGAVDGPTRAIAQDLSKRLKQQVIIENKPGAGATIGSEIVAKSAARRLHAAARLADQRDQRVAVHRSSPSTRSKISSASRCSGASPACWWCTRRCRSSSVAELIAYAKERPGQVNYASSGNGSGQHLFMALFASMAGIQLVHVPYRGSGQATTDLLAGTVPMAMPGTAGMVAHIKAGKLRPLAVSGSARSPQLPEVPTLAESGLAGYSAYVWFGLMAPKGHAGGDRRAAQSGAEGRAGHARGQGLHGRNRHRARRLDAGRIRRLLPRRAFDAGLASSRKPAPRSIEVEARMTPQVTGIEHWTTKKTAEGDVRLFLWEKFVAAPEGKPAVLFVHGSSMASTPTFDLAVPGRPHSSVMDWFAERGFVCWCVDMEGYGRSDKHRDITATSPTAPTTWQRRPTTSPPRAASRASSPTASRRARCAPRCSPSAIRERVARLALDAFVWTGEGAPTLEQRRKKLPRVPGQQAPSDRPRFRVLDLRARPSGVRRPGHGRRLRRRDPRARRLDAQRHLHRHVLAAAAGRPARRSTVPTVLLRGQFDGIAGIDDLIEFFKRLPHPGQAVHRDERHLARQLPAEELPDGLPDPARVLHAAGAGLHLVRSCPSLITLRAKPRDARH